MQLFIIIFHEMCVLMVKINAKSFISKIFIFRACITWYLLFIYFRKSFWLDLLLVINRRAPFALYSQLLTTSFAHSILPTAAFANIPDCLHVLLHTQKKWKYESTIAHMILRISHYTHDIIAHIHILHI